MLSFNSSSVSKSISLYGKSENLRPRMVTYAWLKLRVCVCVHARARVCAWACVHSAAQSCPALCDPMDCNLPGSSVHGIFQARILEWVTISFSRGSSQPKDRT